MSERIAGHPSPAKPQGPRGARRGHPRGFTILELMVVVFIIGLAFLASFPFLKQAFQAVQANGSAREVYTDLALARSLALKDQRPYLVEFCGDPPGYMIMKCDNGDAVPNAADFTASPCDDTLVPPVGSDPLKSNVCRVLETNGAYTGAEASKVVRQVNLGGGKSSTAGSSLGLSRVRFGTAGAVGSATPYSCSPAPCGGGIRADGMGLADCDSTNPDPPGPRRFFFHWRGRTARYAATASPCQGVLYLTGRFTTDALANRAVEFTTVGSVRTYRWNELPTDPIDPGFKWR